VSERREREKSAREERERSEREKRAREASERREREKSAREERERREREKGGARYGEVHDEEVSILNPISPSMKKPATDRYLQITIAGETHGVHEVVAYVHANPKRISWSALKHAESMVPLPSQVPWSSPRVLSVLKRIAGRPSRAQGVPAAPRARGP
jgi:hypothetical protein